MQRGNDGMQGINIIQDFFLFDLGGADVVLLGLDWLDGLGEVRANFKELTLKLDMAVRVITLKGEPLLSKSAATLKAMFKALRDEGQG